MSKVRLYVVSFVTAFVLGKTPLATVPAIEHAMNIDYKILTPASGDSVRVFRLSLTRNSRNMCKSFTVRLECEGKLSVLGESRWSRTIGTKDQFVHEFKVIPAPNDTSGFLCHLNFGTEKTSFPVFFVPADSGLRWVETDPRVEARQLELEARAVSTAIIRHPDLMVSETLSTVLTERDLQYWRNRRTQFETRFAPGQVFRPDAALLRVYFRIAQLTKDKFEVADVERRLLNAFTDTLNSSRSLARAYLDSLGVK